MPELPCLPSSSWMGAVSFFFLLLALALGLALALIDLLLPLILIWLRGVGGQEALLVEVAGGVLDDAVVLAILGQALPHALLRLEVLLAATGVLFMYLGCIPHVS